MFKSYKCPHCSNALANHQVDKIEDLVYYFANNVFIFNRLAYTKVFCKYFCKLENIINSKAHKILQQLKWEKIADTDYEDKVFNRTLVLIREGENYMLKIRPLLIKNKCLNNYHLKFNNQEYYFEGLPVNIKNKPINFNLIDDKYALKRYLQAKNFPTSEGKAFFSFQKGYNYGINLGFPLVVKPKDGSLSNHVTAKINSGQELAKAIKIAKEFKLFYIVEKFISGEVHRITVIEDNIFAVKRLAFSIIGDGKFNIRELIELKNAHPYRGEIGQKNSTLHKIAIDQEILRKLEVSNLKLDTILSPGVKVCLKEKVNLNSGCDIIEVTDMLHLANRQLFLSLAKSLNTDILGIDFICQDISQPWHRQESGIIECNSLPYIDMHHYPSEGLSQNAAKCVVNLIMKNI